MRFMEATAAGLHDPQPYIGEVMGSQRTTREAREADE
jgi:hypothetical protein